MSTSLDKTTYPNDFNAIPSNQTGDYYYIDTTGTEITAGGIGIIGGTPSIATTN
ncbi:MAG: hypothetical protein GTN36_01350, partial [Candidatus Aenigmarchaeota archaeon]|nr:hypothetical protein [Candidatus Aenigmarchaeota archaeon]